MLPLARLEGEQKYGAIYVYLFISATLTNAKKALNIPEFHPNTESSQGASRNILSFSKLIPKIQINIDVFANS